MGVGILILVYLLARILYIGTILLFAPSLPLLRRMIVLALSANASSFMGVKPWKQHIGACLKSRVEKYIHACIGIYNGLILTCEVVDNSSQHAFAISCSSRFWVSSEKQHPWRVPCRAVVAFASDGRAGKGVWTETEDVPRVKSNEVAMPALKAGLEMGTQSKRNPLFKRHGVCYIQGYDDTYTKQEIQTFSDMISDNLEASYVDHITS